MSNKIATMPAPWWTPVALQFPGLKWKKHKNNTNNNEDNDIHNSNYNQNSNFLEKGTHS